MNMIRPILGQSLEVGTPKTYPLTNITLGNKFNSSKCFASTFNIHAFLKSFELILREISVNIWSVTDTEWGQWEHST